LAPHLSIRKRQLIRDQEENNSKYYETFTLAINTTSYSKPIHNHLPDIKMWEPTSHKVHSKSRLHQHPAPSTAEHHWGMEQHLAAQTECTNVRDKKKLITS